MKFSYQWLQEFVPGLDTPARELQQLITARTAECEGIHAAGELLAGARVARVVRALPVPNTHLTEAMVDIGAGEMVTVACGAANCREGMRTIWAPIGKKRIQGIDSNGMLASAQELGLGRDAAGIIEWHDSELELKPDRIIEIDNKSLTHRPDLWGHLGMAREVGAITRKQLRDAMDDLPLPGGPDSFDVRVEDFELCPRFSAVVFDNVHVRPSPWWLQYRLTSIGLNPINNIVDIANYVMAELAQPMHAFDRHQLRGDRLIVRRARDGERLSALNDEDYPLSSADGVVADAAGAVSLAGIIGGRDSAISDETSDIVFESANWNASTIRKTSSSLRLRTDASMRFEKAQDPANTVRALARAIALMKQICPEARLAGGLTDVFESLPEPRTVTLRLDVVNRKLGRTVSREEVRDILERLAFQLSDAGPEALNVTIPSWRATKDVGVADDLVEEVGRMVGYDTIAPAAPLVECRVPPDNPERAWYRDLRGMLTARGYTEVYNYSFLSDAQAERFHLPPGEQVRVLNPIASDQNILRSSLIPGIFANIELNAKHFESFRLFEIGREIHNRGLEPPEEVTRLAVAVYGTEGIFELKRIAEAIAPGALVEPADDSRNYEHPARTGNVLRWKQAIGRIFEAHPLMIEGRGAVLDLNLDAIAAQAEPGVAYAPINRFPSSAFDLSILAPRRELAAKLEARLRDLAGSLLENIEYLREYTGPQAPAGTKSVSYRLTVGAAGRTLSSAEIDAVRERIIEKMRGLGYDMRV